MNIGLFERWNIEENFKENAPNLQKGRTLSTCIRFVQEESGSGVNIHKDGLILTCDHCVLDSNKKYKLIFSNNKIYEAECVKSSEEMDLALLKIKEDSSDFRLPYTQIAQSPARKNQQLYCIGNPTNIDMELDDEDEMIFDPPFFHTSDGVCNGYMKCKQEENKKKLGKLGLGRLKHDCWTYWGHSGAPLFNNKSELCGIHNGWNDQNAMRHAIPLCAIQEFVKEYFQESKIVQ